MENFNFKEFSEIIGADRLDQNVKHLCVKSSIVSLNDFYAGFEREVKDITETTPSRNQPSIADFEDVFKTFDAYPANLSKPRKQEKEVSRMNSSILKAVAVSTDAAHDSAESPLEPVKLHTDGCKTGSDIYHDFLKFERKIKNLLKQLQHQALDDEYDTKLKQINVFAQQLEKLLPSNETHRPAFSNQEEEKLKTIVQDMEKLLYLQSNQDVFNSSSENSGPIGMTRLDSLLEVITNTLISISCFNAI